MAVHLRNAPLVEALLEVKWDLISTGPDSLRDPAYKLAVGGLYERLRQDFPVAQELPLAQVPDEMTPYMVKHQFRRERGGWPLVQLGPGIFTLNFATRYAWTQFRTTAADVLPKFIAAYAGASSDPNPSAVHVNSAALRYINAVAMDWGNNNVLGYLGSKLHACFDLPQAITQADVIGGTPNLLNLQIGYPLKQPLGVGTLRFATGHRGQEPALVWELVVQARGDDAPQLTDMDAFLAWISAAHDDVIEPWFLSLIEGDLMEQFK